MRDDGTRKRRTWQRWLLAWLILTVSLWLGMSWSVAYELTRRSKVRRPEPLPQIAGFAIEDIRISTRDGEDLGAWSCDGAADRPVVLLLHGNGGTRGSMLPQMQWLAQEGCAVFAVSLRAHGDSSGDYNDAGYSARHDVVAAVDWIEQRWPDRRIVIWGQSLGGAASVFAAEELGDRVDGYIWECVYGDLRQAVWHRLQLQLPPVLDRVAYYGLMTVSPLVIPDLDRIAPAREAAKVSPHASVLVLAGGCDQRATPAECRDVAAAVGTRAKVVVIDGADHLCLWDKDRAGCVEEVGRFLRWKNPASSEMPGF
jgi:alpha-beta hydrolase superfamily lysophospholipase